LHPTLRTNAWILKYTIYGRRLTVASSCPSYTVTAAYVLHTVSCMYTVIKYNLQTWLLTWNWLFWYSYLNTDESKLKYRYKLLFYLNEVTAHVAPFIKKRGNSKTIVKKNTPKKYETKEFFSHVLLFSASSLLY
jgi:hypothetical protein